MPDRIPHREGNHSRPRRAMCFAGVMVKFHSGYELKEKDFQDVAALCEKFGIELPQGCVQFKNSS